MVKATEFWNYLCEELDYRFFAGVACPGLVPLYKKMNADIMHYIPAANEKIALGLVSGARIAGNKGAVLMDMRFIYDLTDSFKFNVDYSIPLLVIGYNSGGEDEFPSYDFPVAFIIGESFKDDLNRVVSRSEDEKVPGLIVIEKGGLS